MTGGVEPEVATRLHNLRPRRGKRLFKAPAASKAGFRVESVGAARVEFGGGQTLAMAGRDGRRITPRSPIERLASG